MREIQLPEHTRLRLRSLYSAIGAANAAYEAEARAACLSMNEPESKWKHVAFLPMSAETQQAVIGKVRAIHAAEAAYEAEAEKEVAALGVDIETNNVRLHLDSGLLTVEPLERV